MKLHPFKCKLLSFSLKRANYYVLSFYRYSYELGNSVLDYCHEEKDFGVINIISPKSKISWESHYNSIIIKATRQLGLLRRTCHFIINQSQKRSL